MPPESSNARGLDVSAPPPSAPPGERLAAAAAALAGRVDEPEVRVQLHALAALLDGFEPETAGDDERGRFERALAAAIEAGDEPRVIEAMRRLAAFDRAAVRSVNWSAASGG
jgi:hypothetical protein